ncbi:MAG: DNA mismatch repair protein MutS, partial [Acidobacteriota bacterium]
MSSTLPSSASATPAMRQYLDVKRTHRDALVVFRMGDFYEMFYEDAVAAARVLELTLTSRAKDASGTAIPMCGFPFHALDTYLGRLIRKGYRVAICDQVEDPKKAKGLVKREVTRVVSPGTFTEASFLEAREPAFLAALSFGSGPHPAVGIAFLDTSTGEFAATECIGPGSRTAASAELAVIRPKELLVADDADITDLLPVFATVRVTRVEAWTLDPVRAQETLLSQFRVASLAGYGLDHAPFATAAAGAIVDYVRSTQKADLTHVRDITLRSSTDALAIDPVTLRHLNVVEGVDGGREGSLLDAIDRTITAMGGRQLRGWLLRPLVTVERIQDRLDAVEDFAFRTTERTKLRDTLKGVHDLERLIARISLGTCGPRDIAGLGQSLALVPRVRMLLSELSAPLIRSLVAELDDLVDVRQDIDATLIDEPPALARDGGMVRDGVDSELDDLRGISRGGKTAIAAMEEAERERTGISNLKVRYNRVFGYYIEISKSNLDAVPTDYIRKQTVVGGERYITPGLKEFEEKVLTADERILTRELEIFDALRKRVIAEA